MYGANNGFGGPPPFRPPPGNLPPFPPNLAPGAPGAPGAPSGPSNIGGYHPFPPLTNFVRPPFPPHLPQAPMPMPMPNMYQNGSPLPVRPQGMPFGNSPVRPMYPGIGLPPNPSALPTPPHRQPSTNFVKPLKTTDMFVGSIAPGIDDATLMELLTACGPIHELKRGQSNGKSQAFGFVSIENPEVVMRCIRCLDGVELPDLSPEGIREKKPSKPLRAKVDEKTKAFLDEFEQTVGRTDDDEEADAAARKTIAAIIARIVQAHAPVPEPTARHSGGQSPITVIVPAHLQDLREGDLPENQRVAVLDQISVFRENAARLERQQKLREEELEMAKYNSAGGYKRPPNPAEYGYGQRGFQTNAQGPSAPFQQPQRGNDRPLLQANGQGPQGYSKPVGFVKAHAAEAKVESGRTDEEEEDMRQMRLAREKEGKLRERERQVENRERYRLENLNREMSHRRQQGEAEDRTRRAMAERLDRFDDDEVADRGKELFFADRTRWRNTRHLHRTREYQDDVRDRQAEQDEIKALEKESEEFMRRQMEEMARMEEVQKQRGLLTEDAAPVKLALAVPATAPEPAAKAKAKVEPAPAKARPAPAIAFDNDDEEEVAADKRKQRTFVKLEYDEKDVVDSTAEAEKAVARNRQLLEVRSRVPRDKRTLWGMELNWKAINESATKAKILSFVNGKLEEYLGEVDKDLSDFVMEKVADRSSPQKVVDELESVLAEDAYTLVVQLWRLLAFETAAARAGLPSGTMLV